MENNIDNNAVEISKEEKPIVTKEKKGFFANLSESGKELVAETGILFLAGLMFIVPVVMWAINSGFFGEILLSGRGHFSPFFDRLLLLSVMFFTLYVVSWIKPEMKYRALKVFGVMALLALLSVVAIQFDNVLVTTRSDVAPLMNRWFFTTPAYIVTSLTAVFTSEFLYIGWQFFATLAAFLIISGVLLWDIKVELAGTWKKAIQMWILFEVIYLILFWLIIQFLGWPMFPPVAI